MSRVSPSIVKKTVWARWKGNEWVATRWSGELVASNKYQEELIRTLRALASDPLNNILAIAWHLANAPGGIAPQVTVTKIDLIQFGSGT